MASFVRLEAVPGAETTRTPVEEKILQTIQEIEIQPWHVS